MPNLSDAFVFNKVGNRMDNELLFLKNKNKKSRFFIQLLNILAPKNIYLHQNESENKVKI